jgi:type VI secretion system protein ImpE
LPEDARLQLELCAAMRSGDTGAASELVEQAAQARAPVAGTCNGQPFDDLRDLDDRLAGVLEVITATGKYYWVPWSSLRTLELAPPERPADLLWRKAEIDVAGGPEGQVFIPVRYPTPTGDGWDDQLRLGRATTWGGEDPGPVHGLGQRMLLVGQDSLAWMEIQRIEVAHAD